MDAKALAFRLLSARVLVRFADLSCFDDFQTRFFLSETDFSDAMSYMAAEEPGTMRVHLRALFWNSVETRTYDSRWTVLDDLTARALHVKIRTSFSQLDRDLASLYAPLEKIANAPFAHPRSVSMTPALMLALPSGSRVISSVLASGLLIAAFLHLRANCGAAAEAQREYFDALRLLSKDFTAPDGEGGAR
jgi:hypothetical protein